MSEPTDRERIAAALGRVDRACAELTEAEQDFPPDYAGLREVVRQANEKLVGMSEFVRPQHGLGDTLTERWLALKPRIEALSPTDEMDQDDLVEAITVARKMDTSDDPSVYAEAREWFNANGLPTTWRPTRVPR